MKKELKIKVILVAGALAIILAVTPLAFASDTKADAPADEKQKVEETKQDQTAEKRKEMMEEARSAIRETENALKALDEKKNKAAIVCFLQCSMKSSGAYMPVWNHLKLGMGVIDKSPIFLASTRIRLPKDARNCYRKILSQSGCAKKAVGGFSQEKKPRNHSAY